MNTDTLITINDEHIFLNMRMTPRNFAQSRLLPFLEESGYLVNLNHDGSADTCEWKFSETAENNGILYVTGILPASESWKDLLTVLQQRDSASISALSTVYAASCHATESGFANASFFSPACTLLSESGKVLFLPRSLSEQAARGGNDAAFLLGCWQNPKLTDRAAVNYTLSVCVYYLLTGELPYPETDNEKRENDRYDRVYLPLAVLYPQIRSQLVETADAYLTCKPSEQNIVQRRTFPDDMSSELRQIQTEISQTDAALIAQRKNDYRRRQTAAVKKKRLIRMYSGAITAAFIIATIIFAFAASIVSGKKNLPTVQGLSAIQVVQAFYKGVQELDTSLMQAAVYKNAAKNYCDYISTMYVTAKMRQSVENISSIPPAQWLWVLQNPNMLPFGICRFCINGIPQTLDITVQTIRDNPEPVKQKNAVPGANQTETYSVSYNYFAGISEGNYIIRSARDTVTLSFIEKSWLITDFEQTTNDIQVPSDSFIHEFAQLTDSGISVAETADTLRTTYDWLPSREELTQAKTDLLGQYPLLQKELPL